jgi:hypothetical protein
MFAGICAHTHTHTRTYSAHTRQQMRLGGPNMQGVRLHARLYHAPERYKVVPGGVDVCEGEHFKVLLVCARLHHVVQSELAHFEHWKRCVYFCFHTSFGKGVWQSPLHAKL